MEVIDQFVKVASQALGESEKSTRSATAGLLEALREQTATEDFRLLIEAIPGAELLLHTHAAETVEESQHGIGSALGWVRGWMGGTTGEIGLLGALTEAGFSTDKVGRFVAMFKEFATQHAGQGAVEKLFSEAPDLSILEQKGHDPRGR
jgi:hypothetical protein